MLRNPEVRRSLLAAAAIAISGSLLTAYCIAVAGSLHSALIGCMGVLTTSALVTGVFAAATRARYRTLASLAHRLGHVLAGERSIDFADMSEGELAILSSELDKVVARLNLAVDELRAQRLALCDSLADISHQLKTPLTSIAIGTELVRGQLMSQGASAEVVERIELIQRLQNRVEDLVSALLKLARIDAGVIRLSKAPVDATALIDKAFEPLAIAFDIAGVDFSCDAQEGATFEGDLTWSAEALGNVLKNCLEHTARGGAVCVRATEDALACRIRVEDSGCGIDPTDLPHIFERFYRGRTPRPESEPSPMGVGIGLSLAKSLTVAQGGTLTAENTGHGAAFTFVFFKTVI